MTGAPTPLVAARAALAPAAPEWRAVIAAQLLAEALGAVRATGALQALLESGALEPALRRAEAIIDATPDPRAVRPGDEVLHHMPAPPQGAGLGPQRRSVVVDVTPAAIIVAVGPKARLHLPHGSVVRNFRLTPENRHGCKNG